MCCGEGKVPPSGTFGCRPSIFEVGDVIADLTSSFGFLVLLIKFRLFELLNLVE